MTRSLKIQELRRLQNRADKLRKQLGFSKPGEIICQYEHDLDELIVVEADGFGGAEVSRVEGNHPIDYSTHETRKCATEEKASQFAEQLHNGEISSLAEDGTGKE